MDFLSYLGFGSEEEEKIPEEIAAAAAATAAAHEDEQKEVVRLDEAQVKEGLASLQDELSKCEDLAPYTLLGGKTIPVAASQLLGESSLHGFVSAAYGDIPTALGLIKDTLEWRKRVFGKECSELDLRRTRAAELLVENRRVRYLGKSAEGDLVLAVDNCFGDWINEDACDADVLHMSLLGVECVVAQMDACGHPKVVLIIFGGPAPYTFTRCCVKVLSSHYPGRLKKVVVYPVPHAWSWVFSSCMYFIGGEMRERIALVAEEQEVVEAAGLQDAEILPARWRGGFDAVAAEFDPDTTLLNSMVMEYLNPFADNGEELEEKVECTWSASAAPEGPELDDFWREGMRLATSPAASAAAPAAPAAAESTSAVATSPAASAPAPAAAAESTSAAPAAEASTSTP
mmetsp:Transcript_93223/g.240915  ORF Transcript_93223/g.240915 Transcript_93223/m.240915 type:complete len:401 (+) Transcript_93223:24-1226(+)